MTPDGDIIIRGGSHVVMVANRDVLFGRTYPTYRDRSWQIQSQIDSRFCPQQQKSGSLPAPVFLGKFFAKFEQLLENFDQKYAKLWKNIHNIR